MLTNYAKVDQSLTARRDASNTAGYNCQAVIDIVSSQAPSSAPSPVPATPSPTHPPVPKNESRCECWFKPDVIACPIVRFFNDYECGGGSGTFNYECDEEEQDDEEMLYLMWNILPFVYKFLFLGFLRIIVGCTLVDFGETTVVCLRCGNAFWMLVLGNILLLLLIYVSRCFWPIWAFFMFIWLHFDCILCIVNRMMNVERKAPAKP